MNHATVFRVLSDGFILDAAAHPSDNAPRVRDQCYSRVHKSSPVAGELPPNVAHHQTTASPAFFPHLEC